MICRRATVAERSNSELREELNALQALKDQVRLNPLRRVVSIWVCSKCRPWKLSSKQSCKSCNLKQREQKQK